MNVEDVLEHIRQLPHKDDGRVYISALKPLVRALHNHHPLAIELWNTGIKAAREVAVRIADPKNTSEALLEEWVQDLDEWGITDAFTGHLVKYTPFTISKAHEWANREPEFVRRAGFATIAQMAWGKNHFEDAVFLDCLPLIEEMADDDRFYVKKAVNWALRDIGKRNGTLNLYAQELAKKLQSSDNKTACWVGKHRSKEFMGRYI